jgi:general secretion pathway protein G
MIATSLDTFRLDVGSYPNAIIQLRNSNTVNWEGPYLPKMGLWTYGGNPYIYLVPSEDGQPFSLNSYGKDGVAGGTDEDQNVIY